MAPRSGARELTLKRALESIESGSKATGATGLDDLCHIFKAQLSTSGLTTLDDKSYHRIFEAIFRYAVSEKQSYYSGKGSKSVSTGRLAKCAEALRLTVEHGASRIKRKTVLAVVDHITDTLPHTEDEIVPPLGQNYIKALAALLGQAASVELLATFKGDGWNTCLEFILSLLEQCVETPERESGPSRDSPASGAGQSLSLPLSTPRSTAQSKHGSIRSPPGHLPDLMQCLFALVSAPNAPLLEHSAEISSVVLQVLQLRSLGISQLHQSAFAILNTLFVVIQTDKSDIASSLAADCLPLIDYWWQARTASKHDALLNGVRAEMLNVLLNVHLQLEYLTKQDSQTQLLEDIESLSDMLWNEYARRDERAQLQQDDLVYFGGPHANEQFRTSTFALRSFNVEGERNWAVVHVLALLETLMWKRSQSTTAVLPGDGQPRKRQRTAAGSSRIRQKLRSVDRHMQFAALQVLPFFFSAVNMTVDETAELLSLLVGLITNKDSKLSTWAMVSCASIASRPCAHDKSLSATWRQAWQIAARSVSMTATCRSSSFLLHSIITNELVDYRDVADDINSIVTTADVNGPATLGDSSLVLMMVLLNLRNYHLPNASHASCNHVVRWMLFRWDPADPSFISASAAHVSPANVVNLMRAAYGEQPFTPVKCTQTISGSIGECALLLQERESLVRYLLLATEDTAQDSNRGHQPNGIFDPTTNLTDTSSAYGTKKLVAELFYPKLEEIQNTCDGWTKKGDGFSQITPEKLQSVFSCLLVGVLNLPLLVEVNTRQSQGIEEMLSAILKTVLRAVSISSDSQTLYECLLRLVRPYMPTMSTHELSRLTGDLSFLHQFLSDLAYAIMERANKNSLSSHEDPMDVDDEFDSHESRSSTASSNSFEISRRESAVVLQAASFYMDTTQRLHLFSALHEDKGQIGLVPSSFLDTFLQLPAEEILACRCLVRELFNSDLILNPDDAQKVIERLGGLIGKPALMSCEVTLCTCLDVMEGSLAIWSDGESELSSLVGDLYSHLLKSGLKNNLLSPRAQKILARLLVRLWQDNGTFSEAIGMASPGKLLLSLLESSSLPVKYYIGSQLPSIFGRHVLRLHEDLFLDVLENLPTNHMFPEGIALRLFILAEIAQAWPTLLRRGVYHIFEVPPNIPQSIHHATYCLQKISSSLKLRDPRELFDLFASQVLYTWLEGNEVKDIPFEIFGFSSLQELLYRAQSEVVAIMVMRDQETAVAEFANILGVTTAQLIQNNFSKTVAYSMAHDITKPKTEQQQRSGESRLRKILGREPFLEGIYNNFSDIIGLFFSLIDQEAPIENSWAKDESFTYAAEAMAAIKECGHSDVELNANQQPSFHAKYLVREIALLCSRTEYELGTLWHPALVVSVARRLLNGIHPALGPLHTCSILRKVRVLICLAGSHAWKSYPLEMILHSIRPLLVDTECADDALGISRYLLERGSEALTQSPSFLAAYSLNTLASLRVFMETTQSSTTQESQFKATMNKAHKFHSWFSKYLEGYESLLLRNGKQRDAFKTITQSAANVRSSGNAERDTHESRLLLSILQDESDGTHLLNESSRKAALEMLCRHFAVPGSHNIDVVRSDGEAQDLATAVWKSCQRQSLSDEYLAWAGRVVGRGFAASGHIEQDLLRESRLSQICKSDRSDFESEQGILTLLQSLTSDRDHFRAGLAESALRTIVSEAIAQDDQYLIIACQKILSEQLLIASDWSPYRTPPSDNPSVDPIGEGQAFSVDLFGDPNWARSLTVCLAQSCSGSIILTALPSILANVEGFAEEAFPYIVHLVLLFEREAQQSAKRAFSTALKQWLRLDTRMANENIAHMMNAILYLRTQKLPGESSIADRSQWLDLDLSLAASASTRCGMFKTALLFVEMASGEGSRSSRRSSAARAQESTDVLMDIFENIDDPDAYYGLSQAASLGNVLARLEYEKDGSKSLAFRGAQYDSHIRAKDPSAPVDAQSLVSSLSNLGLAGLSHSLLQNQQSLDVSPSTHDTTFSAARRLEIWNLPAPSSTQSPAVTLYKTYQAWSHAAEVDTARKATYSGFQEIMRNLVGHNADRAQLRAKLGTLAALTELNDALDIAGPQELEDLLTSFDGRERWMRSGRYDDISHILSCRETTLNLLSQASQSRGKAKVNAADVKLVQVRSLLLSTGVYRYHQATQESLNIATSLRDLIQPSSELGLLIDSAARIEAANSLWDHGEMMPSIRLLQNIDEDTNLKKQTIPVSRADLLAKTGYQISVARFEKPDSIQRNYLQPALKELKGRQDGEEAGKVYHQFAMFCDEQLQNPDSLEDLARLQHLREGKNDEVMQLRNLIANARDTQAKNRYQGYLLKAKQWLDLDEQELRRVEQSRGEFVRLSLENYLLSLIASDDHNDDSLRFTALWLERSGEDFTNEAVRKYIDKVETRKLAPLMNQLTSRLLDHNNLFQKLLAELVYRICVDHPYHGMYQIWSGTKSRTNPKDEVAVLRHRSTDRISKKLLNTESVAAIWAAINSTSKAYHNLASERDPARYKGGQKISIKDSAAGLALLSSLAKYHIPPPTMQIELAVDRDYSRVPYIAKLEPNMSIAGGVSAPKIVTAVGSNGERYKQLVKGGNDDLRQDAIMEQVFSAVSSVLQRHRATRQRDIGIRTYKVLPLTAASGLIEFVPNTIPLHEYLIPAHERYHPKDLKGQQCRKEISNVQSKSAETRISTYKKVTDKFQPVMHFFFMEYFVDPDDWFAKRTAYTRTTAAISMLGHILGLGDRHGHNILLDSKTGEVVHIDLGVAFEMGRVLPVPELVPFRLTRDIVDGMGITKTEGVFRRCCEFTLDALREETYSIMTILDVLRYDPLYSWSISPVRMAKLQDTRRDEETGAGTQNELDPKRKRSATALGVVNEPSEADRALEVVRKKLSKTLSVTATVNDLINQATDERNLAVLYSGWAAYA
ncbi:phosphatidylinositol 3 [Xylariomycetidae sp. FL2044]|nr:phosphatidylinositol 3 [Xylariomycetidae sp. FL2044]